MEYSAKRKSKSAAIPAALFLMISLLPVAGQAAVEIQTTPDGVVATASAIHNNASNPQHPGSPCLFNCPDPEQTTVEFLAFEKALSSAESAGSDTTSKAKAATSAFFNDPPNDNFGRVSGYSKTIAQGGSTNALARSLAFLKHKIVHGEETETTSKFVSINKASSSAESAGAFTATSSKSETYSKLETPFGIKEVGGSAAAKGSGGSSSAQTSSYSSIVVNKVD